MGSKGESILLMARSPNGAWAFYIMEVNNMDETNWSIAESDQGFDYWLSRDYISTELRQNLEGASLIIVPQEGFKDYDKPVFPVGTEEFFHFLKDNEDKNIQADICVEDNEYRELALHAGILVIAGIVVTALVLPITVNLVSRYLEQRLWPNNKSNIVKHRITVIEKIGDTTKAIDIKYEGPAVEYESSMRKALVSLSQKMNVDVNGEEHNVPLPAEHSDNTDTKDR